jgi:hypothetical protein
MNKLIRILSLLFLVSLTQFLFADSGIEISRGPYLQLQTDTSIAIVWCTSTESVGEVMWGMDTHCSNKLVSNVTTKRHEVSLTKLKPDTLYYYQVIEGDSSSSELLTFRTEPNPGTEKISFTIQGDSRSNPSQCKKIFDAMIPQTMNGFCLSLGDLAGRGEDNKTDYWQSHFFVPAKEFVGRICLYPVIGNHEVYDEKSFPGYVYPKKYQEIWSLPPSSSGSKCYYSFDKGDIHFTCVDVFWSSYTIGSEQYNWLEKDLRDTHKRWKIVFMHTGPYISQNSTSTGTMSTRNNLVPLFEKYYIDMVCYGHYHIYQRNIVNGITYLVQGAGGASIGNADNSQPYVQNFANEFCFTRIDIDGNKLLGKTYGLNGSALDEFVISKKGK